MADYLTEKRLRPLYEAVDEGQHKQALQIASKLLKKTPDWPLVKSLKAVVLVRTGKTDEALELCTSVKKTIPTDEPTLQALTMCYRELGKHGAIVELYENAANQQPKNEEFGNNWFMAMVRNGDYMGQQQAALKLHRTFKQNKYLFWAIMSLALQGQKSSLSYTLAERMMAKAQEEGRLEEVEHLRLFLLILLNQNKNQEALLLLNSELGQKAQRDPEVRQVKMELMITNKKWPEVLEAASLALRNENSDDWISWKAYFDAIEALATEDHSDERQKVASELVLQLQEATKGSTLLKRGPFLAQLELDYRLNRLQKGEKSHLISNIVSYFERFSSKACCFEDLQTYVTFLRSDPPAAKAFVQTLWDTIKESEEKSQKIKNVYKRVNVRKIEHFLDLHENLGLEKSLALVEDLWQSYLDALPLGKDLEKTESQFGDDFILLACHILLDLYHANKQPAFILQGITFLETALPKSAYNFQLKLMLVRLYVILGVHTRTMQIYRTMDIKQIQFDTMTHYFTDRFISLGCNDSVEDILMQSLSIYKSNEIETPEMIVKAYQYGTYSKIQEFIEFRKRLETSLQESVTQIELARLRLVRSSFQVKYGVQFFQELDVSKIHIDDDYINALSDNRDFKVMISCNAESRPKTEELSKLVKSTNKTWVHLFSYLLHILKGACGKADDVKDDVVERAIAILDKPEVKTEVTEEELQLAKCTVQIARALKLVKDPSTRSKNATEASQALNVAIEILKNASNGTEEFSETNISWVLFHKLSIALEMYNYVSILVEMINKALNLTSKDARRKAAENANNDAFMTSFVSLQNAIKDHLLKAQANARQGVDVFKSQLQKKLVKSVTETEFGIPWIKNKENQNVLTESTKKMIASWSSSVGHIAEEINRRVQKM